MTQVSWQGRNRKQLRYPLPMGDSGLLETKFVALSCSEPNAAPARPLSGGRVSKHSLLALPILPGAAGAPLNPTWYIERQRAFLAPPSGYTVPLHLPFSVPSLSPPLSL